MQGPRPDPKRALSGSIALAAAIALAASGCAKKGVPSGGPPDVTAPRLAAAYPESAAARVPRSANLSITFSEGMEPRSTGDAVSLAPRVEFKQKRWSGKTLTLVLADSLAPRQTYVMFVGGGARDRHGIPMGSGAAVTFSTADSFPPGRIRGRIEAHGFGAEGTYVWCYDEALGRVPDSTAHDFDALGLADAKSEFEVLGLHVPGRYRLWAFADLNSNRSFEPDVDILAPADTSVTLTRSAPAADHVVLSVTNPRAPAALAGAVLDTLGDSLGVIRIMAVSERDSSIRQGADVGRENGFEIQLSAGRWRLAAWRDLDNNRQWAEGREPASAWYPVELAPAEERKDVTLVLRRPQAVGSGP